MKLGEVVVHMGTTTSEFHQNWMKKQLHQVSSKSDKKHKSFNYRPFNRSVVR